jgi:hypothetical protein
MRSFLAAPLRVPTSVLLWIIAVLAASIFAIAAAQAEWKPEYAQADPAVRDWYLSAELTEAAQKRFPFKSCCAHSDVVKTRFRPTMSGDDGWEYLDGNQWRRVPDDIIHWDKTAPSGDPVMFAINGQPVCFFPPQGGI